MVKFKIVEPFISEMLLWILFLTSSIWGFHLLTFKLHLLTIVFSIILIGSYFAFFSNVANLGIRALFDFMFQRSKSDDYEFIQEFPYKASTFGDRVGPNHEQLEGIYYLIVVKKNNEIFNLISPVNLDLNVGENYVITVAASSKVVLNWSHKSFD